MLDLSDEPVLGPPARFRLAARALALGVPYEGADFRLEPPRFEAIRTPSVAVIGTGKRVGKTAVTGHVARVLARERQRRRRRDGAWGAGGARGRRGSGRRWPTCSRSRARGVTLRPTTSRRRRSPGCRPSAAGAAAAASPARSASRTSLAGTRLAEELDPDLIVLDGSGAALPPIAADRRILVVGAHQDHAVATGYLNPYRALLADLVVVTMAEDGSITRRSPLELGELTRPGVPIVRAVLRPRPLADVRGRRVAFFGTAPAAQHERIAAASATPSTAPRSSPVSGSLSDRGALRRELASLDAEVVVVEIKAAAIDVVAEEAARRGIEVVLAGNDVVPLPGEPDLDVELERLAVEAIESAMVGV